MQTDHHQPHYRAAIIGHTGHGNYGHGLDTCFTGLPRVTVVAVADPDPGGQTAAQERSGAERAYGDYQQMLEQERPDLVAIAPRLVDGRMDMIAAAARAGVKGIYCEKPFAATLADADTMLALCARAGVKIAVAHQNRLHPATLHLQQLVANGRIGRPRQVRGYGKMDHRGGGQDLAVLGPHILDLMRLFAGEAHWCSADLLVGSRLATATDVREGEEGVGPVLGDGLRAAYGFDNDVIGSFESYRMLGDGSTVFGIDVVGEKGQLALRGSFTKRLFFSPYPYPEPGLPDDRWMQVPVPSAGPHEQVGEDPPNATEQKALQQRANQRLVLDLIAAIEADREPASSGQRARAALELIQAVAVAHAAGGRVSLPLTTLEHPCATAAVLADPPGGTTTMTTATMRHLGIRTRNLTASRRFYEEGLGLRYLGRRPSSTSIDLSDGEVNLTLLPYEGPERAALPEGSEFVHLGFHVEDLGAAYHRLVELGAHIVRDDIKERRRPSGQVPAGSFKVLDPDGTVLDISERPDEWRTR